MSFLFLTFFAETLLEYIATSFLSLLRAKLEKKVKSPLEEIIPNFNPGSGVICNYSLKVFHLFILIKLSYLTLSCSPPSAHLREITLYSLRSFKIIFPASKNGHYYQNVSNFTLI